MTTEQSEFLEFLFPIIGSCPLNMLAEEELEDFVAKVWLKYIIEAKVSDKLAIQESAITKHNYATE